MVNNHTGVDVVSYHTSISSVNDSELFFHSSCFHLEFSGSCREKKKQNPTHSMQSPSEPKHTDRGSVLSLPEGRDFECSGMDLLSSARIFLIKKAGQGKRDN